MTLLRCLLVLLLATLLICTSAERVCAQKPTRNFVEIEFPIGDIEVIFVESSRGMILVATSGTIRMRARRIYFGDGKRAVKYEASKTRRSRVRKIGGRFLSKAGLIPSGPAALVSLNLAKALIIRASLKNGFDGASNSSSIK